MKKQLLTAALALFAMVVNAQNYTVKATLNGLPDGTEIELVPMSHDNEKPIATAIVKGGQIALTGQQSDPRLIWMRVKNSYGVGKFMLDNSNITIAADVRQEGTSQGLPVYNFTNMKVSGSPLTDEYYKMYDVRNQLDEVYQSNAKKYAGVQQQLNNAKTDAERKAIKVSNEYKAMLQADSIFSTTWSFVLTAPSTPIKTASGGHC